MNDNLMHQWQNGQSVQGTVVMAMNIVSAYPSNSCTAQRSQTVEDSAVEHSNQNPALGLLNAEMVSVVEHSNQNPTPGLLNAEMVCLG